MVLDVIAIVEGGGVVAAGDAVVGHAIGTARGFRIDKDVLAPAHIQQSIKQGTRAQDVQRPTS